MTHHPPNARKWLRRVTWAGAALGAATLLAFLALRGYYGGRLEAERAKLEELGLPTTMAGIEALYPEIPDEENGALVFIKAAEALGEPPSTALRDTIPRWVLNDPNRSAAPFIGAIRAYLDRNSEALALAHKAAGYSDARYPVVWTPQMTLQMPHRNGLLYLRHLLQYAIIVAAHDGDKERWFAGVSTMAALGHSLEDEPIPDSQRFRRTYFLGRLLFPEIRRAFTLGLFNREDFEALQEMLIEQEQRDDWRTAYDFEATVLAAGLRGIGPELERDLSRRLYREVIGEDMRQALERVGLGDVIPAAYRRLNVVDAAVAKQASLTRRLYETLSMPYHQGQPLRDKLNQRVDNDITVTGGLVRERWKGQPYLFRVYAENQARRRLWIAYLALERHRLDHGAYPDTLQSLVPDYLDAVPNDPNDGKPLDYTPPEPVGAIESEMGNSIGLYAEEIGAE